jgi:GH25 family lysozyme M1 (1,4-beta-N-acetylmuramidase)
MRARGVDVSRWKPVADWNALKASGVTFVGFKATEGNTVVDRTFRGGRDAFRATGFSLGLFYHFARSGRADLQAERLMDLAGPLQDNERLVLDFEVMTTEAPEDGLAWIDLFFQTLSKSYSDRRHIIYTSKRIWRMMGDPAWTRASQVDLWAPRYNAQASEPALPVPWAEAGWSFWQWTDGDFPLNVTPGVGKCDANYFRGSDPDLVAYAQLLPAVA